MAIKYGSKPCNEQLMRSVKQVQGTAKTEPDQGKRTPDSGAGGCVSLEGRGTMEQK